MKLSVHAFTRFWDVHAWSGVVGGLVLYVMFLAGAITLFHEPLGVWEEPLAQEVGGASVSHEAAIDLAVKLARPSGPTVWYYPTQGQGLPSIAYDTGGQGWTRAFIDVENQRLVPERERLSSFLYSLHFLWHDSTGDALYYLAGILSVLLLLAIVTGVLIHLKDIVRQFHQFRPQKARRVLFSDMHKVLGVMGLPFQLMYAYTGALIVLGGLMLPAFVGPVFGGDERRANTVAYGRDFETRSEPGAVVSVLSADALLQRARQVLHGAEIETVRIEHHGRENGSFEVWGQDARNTPENHSLVRLREVDGALIASNSSDNEDAAGAVRRWVYGLHFADFGGWPLRFLFFTLGILGCATLLTGNWVWLSRRSEGVGHRVLLRLTTGIGAGTLTAIAAMFLASRVLPLEVEHRGTLEELAFLGVWLGCITWALLARESRSVWWQQLSLAGAMLLPVPVLAARWSQAGLFGAGPPDATVCTVDATLLVVAVSFLAVAFGLRRSLRSSQVAPPVVGEQSKSEGALVIAFRRRRDV